MAIRTLVRSSLGSIVVLVEKSDSGKLFVGTSYPDNNACYTFDLSSKHENKLVELVNNALVQRNNVEYFVNIDMDINHDRKVISYSSRTNEDPERVPEEIRRAYSVIKMSLNKLGSIQGKTKLQEEAMQCLRMAFRHSEKDFESNYRIYRK